MARHRRYKRDGRYLFVDGYNIINYWSDFDGLIDEHLEEARELLVDLLEEYAATEHLFIILVFDAYRVKGNGGSIQSCLLYTSPSPRDVEESRMPSSA